ncbi:peptidase M24A methionine aminopeptidase [Cyathus striatus]|nr:peptidase M24A methionine aminopeptidase [Cyathus striatus]
MTVTTHGAEEKEGVTSGDAKVDGNAEELESDDEDDLVVAAPEGGATKKKKKKKPKKKKPVQTDPPRVPIAKFYPSGNYPEGEIQEYKDDNTYRLTSAEKKHIEQLIQSDPEETYANIRKAAAVHRAVRASVRKYMRPGVKLVDVAEYIEDGVRALVEAEGLEAGIAFPTGVNVNHCAAHWSPRTGEVTEIQQSDVIKIDFGVHVKGRIVDSAFTVNFEPTYDVLLEAVRAATNAGVKAAGIDARLGEVAGEIQETMESYEVEVGGKVFPVKPIENLSGHSIHKYQIHGDKSILLVKNDDPRKMEEGEYFAVETFGSTGRGRCDDGPECSHFGKRPGLTTVPPLRLNSAKSLLKSINKNFGTLAFTQRYLERAGESKYLLALNHLISQGIVQEYPPLYDQRGSMTAQFEHTILLRPTCKEVVSRGDDY